ncbi:MAG: transcriptional repressor [Deltaproteobacteria bacterium]|nr:MAG: transcriptional repressor [Deltaproteobacteria bacterium]
MNKDIFKELIRENRLRLSHPRFLIYQELSEAATSLSPQELYHLLHKKKRKIGLTSIYRCLDLFESLEIVFRVAGRPNVKYRLCESDHHHHHIVCKQCGKVVELNFCDISDWSKKVTECTGYEVTDHRLNFYGYCGNCRKEG